MSKATVLIRAKRKVEKSCPGDCEKCDILSYCATYRSYGLRTQTEESIRRDYLEQKAKATLEGATV